MQKRLYILKGKYPYQIRILDEVNNCKLITVDSYDMFLSLIASCYDYLKNNYKVFLDFNRLEACPLYFKNIFFVSSLPNAIRLSEFGDIGFYERDEKKLFRFIDTFKTKLNNLSNLNINEFINSYHKYFEQGKEVLSKNLLELLDDGGLISPLLLKNEYLKEGNMNLYLNKYNLNLLYNDTNYNIFISLLGYFYELENNDNEIKNILFYFIQELDKLNNFDEIKEKLILLADYLDKITKDYDKHEMTFLEMSKIIKDKITYTFLSYYDHLEDYGYRVLDIDTSKEIIYYQKSFL